MQQTISSSDVSVLGEAFWRLFLLALEELSEQERIIIGLSGGSSLDSFYEEMKRRYQELDTHLCEKIFFAFLDERIVLLEDVERNERQLREKLLTGLLEQHLIKASQILSVDTEVSDIARAYSKKVPRIDIALFGVGPDGHIASLFPHHPLLESAEGGFLEIIDSPKPPPHRITVSPRMIREMGEIFLIFRKGKEDAFMHFQDEKVSVRECPAKLLTRDDLIVLSDIAS